jgi:hypothetical protein
MIYGPELLLGFLLATAGAVYFLRRLEGVAATVAAGATAGLAFLVWRLPLDAPAAVFGRHVWLGKAIIWEAEHVTLQIGPATKALLVFLLATAAASFILAWLTYQGHTFYPFGLVLLAVWATVAMLQPLTLAPFAIVLAAIIAVFLIQAGQVGETRGAWRQLLFPTLAAPLFLTAAWYIEQAPLNPDDQTPFVIAGWLLVAGFILLLQPAPLHVAAPAVAGQAPPVVAVFLWIGGQSTVLFLLQRFLVTYPWLTSAIDSARWLLWLGVLTALLAGALTAFLFLPETFRAGEARRDEEEDLKSAVVSGLSANAKMASAIALLGVHRLTIPGILSPTLGLLLLETIGGSITLSGMTFGVATLTGLGLGVSYVVSMASAPFMGRLSDRASDRWRLAAAGLVPGMAGFALLALGSPFFILLGLPLTAFAGGSNQGLSTALVGDLSREGQRGRKMGILFTVGDLTSAIGPLLAYALIPVMGLRVIYVLSGAVLAIMMLVALGWAVRSARAPETPGAKYTGSSL